MESQTANSSHSVRYQPDERPPRALAIGLGLQAAILTFTPIITLPLVIMQAADQGAAYTSWAIFMAVLISGITTIVQAVRVGRFGAGHILIMGTSASFIAVCITALTEGGAGAARDPDYRLIGDPVRPGSTLVVAPTFCHTSRVRYASCPDCSHRYSGRIRHDDQGA